MQFALRACESSGYAVWNHVGTLAAAYAEAGDFDRAVKWAQQAWQMAPDSEKAGCGERLRHFESRKPDRKT